MTLKETQKARISQLEADVKFLGEMNGSLMKRVEQLLDLVHDKDQVIALYEEQTKLDIHQSLKRVKNLEVELSAEVYE